MFPVTVQMRTGAAPRRHRSGLVIRRAMAAVTGGAVGAIGALLLGGSATTALPMVLFGIAGAGALALRVRETAFERTQCALDNLEARLDRVQDLEARDVLLREYATLLASTATSASALPAAPTDRAPEASSSNALPR